MHIQENVLKKLLKENKLLEEKKFREAKNEAKRAGQTLVNVLIGKGIIREDYLMEILSDFFKIPKINLKGKEIDLDILNLIPENIAKLKKVVSFDKYFFDKEEVVKIAMTDPLDLETIRFIENFFKRPVEVYLTTHDSLAEILKQYKKQISEDFNKVIEENIAKVSSLKGVALEKLAENIPIINIIDSVIEYAISLNASDIHFEPLAKRLLIRFRIDGILREVIDIPKIIHPAIIARIKIMSNLLIDEHSKPQDGRFKFKLEEETVDVRVSIMPTFYGEKAVLRLLKSSFRPLNLGDLGLSDYNLSLVRENIKKSYGMILSTGPTGCGKTTTLYTILNILNKPGVNICTIEDPIEYDIPRINQTQVNPKAGITFANGLRSILRQDPDILMVGEIRDAETAEIAIHAALTGHLVLSTLHTNDAPTAIPRFIDLGIQPFLLASTLNAIIAQRLVRKICPNCIESYKLSKEEKKIISLQLKEIYKEKAVERKISDSLYKGKSCKLCNYSGYKGRIGIFEVFNVDEKIRELILKNASIDEIKEEAIKGGMITMFEDGLRKAEAGITTLEEVLRVIRE